MLGQASVGTQSRFDRVVTPNSIDRAYPVGRPRLPERAAQLLKRVNYRRAETDAEKDAILRLRYEAYIREAGTPPNSQRKLFDETEHLENAWSFGLFIDENLVSSLRIHVLSKEHPVSHSTGVFADVLSPHVEAGKVIIDPNRFVADYSSARLFPELPYLTLRLFYMAAEHFCGELVTATVRAEHQAFYKRAFGFHPVCPSRQFPGMTRPITFMLLDVPARRDENFHRHPYLRSTPAERHRLFEGRYDLSMPSHLYATPRSAELEQAA